MVLGLSIFFFFWYKVQNENTDRTSSTQQLHCTLNYYTYSTLIISIRYSLETRDYSAFKRESKLSKLLLEEPESKLMCDPWTLHCTV